MAHRAEPAQIGSALHFRGDGVGVAVRDEFPDRQSPLNLQETIPGSLPPEVDESIRCGNRCRITEPTKLKVTLVTNLLSASGRPAPSPRSLDRPGRLV